jgi:hypothetical protein
MSTRILVRGLTLLVAGTIAGFWLKTVLDLEPVSWDSSRGALYGSTDPVATDAPRDVVAAPVGEHLVVRWSEPPSAGAMPVSRYDVESSPPSAGCSTIELRCSVGGLPRQVAHQFRVRALSLSGWGTWSAWSAPVALPDAAQRSVEVVGQKGGKSLGVVVTGRGFPRGTATALFVRWAGDKAFTLVQPRVRLGVAGIATYQVPIARAGPVRLYASILGTRSQMVVLR